MKLKKIFGLLSLVLTTLICLSSVGSKVYATEKVDKNINKFKSAQEAVERFKKNPTKNRVTVSEYQIYEKLDKLAKSKGEDAHNVENFKKAIFELKNKNTNELKKELTDSQILEIKSFDGTDMQARAIGGDLVLDSNLMGFYHDKCNSSGAFCKTLVDFQMYWCWEKPPITNATDALAIAWKASNGNLICNEAAIESYTYYSLSGWHDYSSKAKSGIRVNDNAVTYNFPLELNVPEMSDSAKWGTMTVELFNTDLTSSSVQISWAYGHSLLSLKPSFSVSTSCSISFGAAWRVDTTQKNKTFYY